MGLTVGEKVGAVVAFIPGVSIISGAIKAYHYYQEMQKSPPLSHRVDSIAQVAVANLQTADFTQEWKSKNTALFVGAIFEMIPFVNILAATFDFIELSNLSNFRDSISTPEKQMAYVYRELGLEQPEASDPNKNLKEEIAVKLWKSPALRYTIPHFDGGYAQFIYKECLAMMNAPQWQEANNDQIIQLAIQAKLKELEEIIDANKVALAAQAPILHPALRPSHHLYMMNLEIAVLKATLKEFGKLWNKKISEEIWTKLNKSSTLKGYNDLYAKEIYGACFTMINAPQWQEANNDQIIQLAIRAKLTEVQAIIDANNVVLAAQIVTTSPTPGQAQHIEHLKYENELLLNKNNFLNEALKQFGGAVSEVNN